MSKDPKNPDTEEQTESQEITGTLTDLGYQESSASSEATLKRLLGSKPIKNQTQSKVLLMPEKISLRSELLKSDRIDEARFSERAICLLGPYDRSIV
ncbi:MAG: hypothetical protein ABIR96_07295, partial [Bdellovibrionota bacterium]